MTADTRAAGDITGLTAADLAGKITARELSSVEVTQAHLNRIAEIDDRLGAFLHVSGAEALAAAKAADDAIAAGNAPSALAGVPLALKDVFTTVDAPTTCGSKILEGWVPPYDATVTARLRAAGIPILGKTNMDEFAMGSSNENSYFGAVKNPWDTARVPGGSSGGSAAAVAALMAPAATGTDTGGSIRQPAALCNLTGLKPTYGVVSRYGMIAYASSLDQGGPMARSAQDCALLLDAMAGFDERDSTSLDRPRENYARDLDKPLAGLKIGLPKEFFGASERSGCAPEVMQLVDAAIAEYRKLGAETVEVSLPNMHLSIASYYVIAPAEASSNLSRFDGVRYGHRASNYRDLTEMYEKSRAEGFGEEVKRRIMVGTYVLSHGYYDAYYIQAQKIRRLIAEDFQRALTECDVILGPVAPTPAWNLGEKTSDPTAMYLADIYTLAVNLAGLPGMSLPAGVAANGRPVGLQLIGNYFAEARLLNVAHQFQQVTDWHIRAPAL